LLRGCVWSFLIFQTRPRTFGGEPQTRSVEDDIPPPRRAAVSGGRGGYPQQIELHGDKGGDIPYFLGLFILEYTCNRMVLFA
jgi:hypothetical protein